MKFPLEGDENIVEPAEGKRGICAGVSGTVIPATF